MAFLASPSASLTRSASAPCLASRAQHSLTGAKILPAHRAISRPLRATTRFVVAGDDKKDEEKKISKDKVLVNFEIEKKTAFGSVVKVVGGSDKLGRWNANDGVALRWSEGDVWKGSVEVPAGGEMEYKLVTCTRRHGNQWEGGINRVLQLYDGGSELLAKGRFDAGVELSHKKPKKELVAVAFNFHGKTEFGHEICVMGGAKELGGWDPLKAKPLKWGPGDVWKGEVDVAPGGEIRYKLITRRASRPTQWKTEFRRDFKRILQPYAGGKTVCVTGDFKGRSYVHLKGESPVLAKKAEKKEEKKEEKKKDEVKAEKKGRGQG